MTDIITSGSQNVICVNRSGIPEAPIDGAEYVRKDADWTVNSGAGIGEAPVDGNQYAREDAAWALITSSTQGGKLTVVENIAERDALPSTEGDLVFVRDASADLSLTIWGLYVFDSVFVIVASQADVNYVSTNPDGIITTAPWGEIATGTDITTLRERSMSSLLDQALFAIKNPTISTTKSLLQSGASAASLEVGTSAAPTITGTFNQGRITNGNQTQGPPLVGLPSDWRFKLPDGSIDQSIVSDNLVEARSFTPYPILKGSNIWDVENDFDAGSGVYTDSLGDPTNVLDAARVAGSLAVSSPATTGAFGFFYGFGAAPTDSAGVRAGIKLLLSQSDTGSFDFQFLDAETTIWFSAIGTPVYQVVQDPNGLPVDITTLFTDDIFNVDDAGATLRSYQTSEGVYGAAGHGDLTIRVSIL